MSDHNIPSIKPKEPLAAEAEAEALRKAMKGFGTNEVAIIKVLTSCSNSQRQYIAQAYHRSYGRDLVKDLKKELSGDFEGVILALMTPTTEYFAKELMRALDKKKSDVIVQILFACERDLLRAIKASYQQLTGQSLEVDASNKIKGVFSEVVVATAAAYREEGESEHVSQEVARAIYNDGNGDNMEAVVKNFALLSYRQLRGVFVEYYKLAGRTLGESFNLELKTEDKTKMQAVFQCLQNPHAYFAGALRKSMAGMGTKEEDLVRVIVSRSEIDLMSIKSEYSKVAGGSLDAAVKADTSGDFEKVLLALLEPNY